MAILLSGLGCPFFTCAVEKCAEAALTAAVRPLTKYRKCKQYRLDLDDLVKNKDADITAITYLLQFQTMNSELRSRWVELRKTHEEAKDLVQHYEVKEKWYHPCRRYQYAKVLLKQKTIFDTAESYFGSLGTLRLDMERGVQSDADATAIKNGLQEVEVVTRDNQAALKRLERKLEDKEAHETSPLQPITSQASDFFQTVREKSGELISQGSEALQTVPEICGELTSTLQKVPVLEKPREFISTVPEKLGELTSTVPEKIGELTSPVTDALQTVREKPAELMSRGKEILKALKIGG